MLNSLIFKYNFLWFTSLSESLCLIGICVARYFYIYAFFDATANILAVRRIAIFVQCILFLCYLSRLRLSKYCVQQVTTDEMMHSLRKELAPFTTLAYKRFKMNCYMIQYSLELTGTPHKISVSTIEDPTTNLLVHSS